MAATLELLVEGQDRSGAALDAADRRLGGLGDRGRMAATALAGIGGAAVGGALGFLGQETLKLDSAMAEFSATAGLTQDQTDGLKQSVIDLGGASLQSEADIAKTMSSLVTMQGVSADSKDELEGLTRQYLDFATATGGDAATAVAGFDDILDGWNLTAADAGPLMDRLVKSQQLYGTSVDGSMNALAKMAPAFQSLGLGLDESIGLINSFARKGVDAESTTTAFNKALALLSDQSEVGKEKIGKMAAAFGMNEEQVASFLALSPADQFREFAKMIGSTSDQALASTVAIDLFGTRAGPKLSESLRDSGGSLDAFNVSAEEAAGTTEEAAKKIEGWFINRLKLLKENVVGTALGFTQDFAPALMAVGTLGPVAGSGIGGVVGVLGTLGPAAKAASLAMSAALLTPPVGVFVLIASALAILALAFSTNLFGIRDFTEKTFGAIKDFLTGNWQEIASIAALFLLGPAGLVVLFTTNAFGIRDAVTGAFNTLKDSIVGIVTDLKNFLFANWREIVTVALAILFPPGAGLWALATNAFGIRDAVVGAFTGILDAIVGLGSRAVSVGQGFIGAITGGVRDAINNVLLSTLEAGINRVIRGMNKLFVDSVNKLDVFGVIPDIGKIPEVSLPRLASGGVLDAPTLFLGGERGREIVAPETTLRRIAREEGGASRINEAALAEQLARRLGDVLARIERSLVANQDRPVVIRELNVVVDGEKIASVVNSRLGRRADLIARGG